MEIYFNYMNKHTKKRHLYTKETGPYV